MANTITAFLETLVAAAGDYNEAVVGQLSLLDAVYKDVKPEAARAGKTIDVYFPDVGPFADQGTSDWTPDDINPQFTSLVFNQHPGKAILIRDFEQFQTAVEIREKFLDPLYKRAAEYLNGKIAGQITSANFNFNPAITGANPGTITVSDHLNAWNALANAKVPMNNSNDLSILMHNQVYQGMLSQSQWVQENIVSAMIAREAREEGKLANAFKFRPMWDQQMPTTGASNINGQVTTTASSTSVTGYNTKFTVELSTTAPGNQIIFGWDATRTPYTVSAITDDTHITLGSSTGLVTATTSAKAAVKGQGTVTLSANSATVTGSSTHFTTDFSVGQSLIFYDVDTTLTPYPVAAVASDTSLTLATPYTGTTGSGKHFTVQGFTTLAMHRYAIGLALRPLPPPDEKVVEYTYLDIKGIPMRVMVSYQHLKNGWLVTVDYGYALGVLRPSFGVIINS
jgi:hypothetical protein